MLSAQDLALDYRTGESVAHAVNTVSLSVEQGSFVGLIGPSGSGKSSLMYLLSGLKRPTRGRVAFEGRDYGDISTPGLMRLRRQRFGFVFQQHFLINYLSTLENVMVGAVKRNHEAVAYAQAHVIPYQLFEPHLPTPKPKAYSDNFKFDRKVPWSH